MPTLIWGMAVYTACRRTDSAPCENQWDEYHQGQNEYDRRPDPNAKWAVGWLVNRSMRRVEGNHKHNLSNGVLKSRGSDSPLAYALRVHINAVHASVFVMLVASLISRRAGTSPLALMYLSKVTMLKTPPALRKIQ